MIAIKVRIIVVSGGKEGGSCDQEETHGLQALGMPAMFSLWICIVITQLYTSYSVYCIHVFYVLLFVS